MSAPRVRAIVAGALAFAAGAAYASGTVELEYGAAPGEVLTIHGGDARGAQPIVVHLGKPERAFVDLLAQRGYVLATVALPADAGTALASAADAIAFVARRAAAHGGDPDRIHLVGAGATAPIAARLGADLEALTGRRVLRESLDAIALRGGHRYALAVAQETPPTLLLHAVDDALGRRDAERYAARLREAGGSAEVAAMSRSAHEADAEIVAWFDAAAVARVGRFEQLAFEPSVDVPDGTTSIVASRGRLVAAGSGGKVLRKDAPDAPWRVEHDFGPRHASIAALGVDDGGARVCALLRGGDAALAYACRERGWSAPVALPLASSGSARRPLLAMRAPGARDTSWYVASEGRIARVGGEGLPHVELDGDAPVVALAWADGRAYAALGGADPVLLRRNERVAAWRRVASIAVDALAAVPDPEGAGHDVLLVATRSGIERIDPRRGDARTRELDFAQAFGRSLGADARVLGIGEGGFAPLEHPYTHDLVHALPLELEHPDRMLRGAYYVVRQLDGSYGYSLVRDFLSPRDRAGISRLRALVPSPFGGAPGVWFLGVDAAGDAVLLRGALRRGAAREGIWWDRSAPGHGLALHPAGDGWLAMLYTYDASGEPAWYLAVGEIADGRFVPDSNGLARYRMATDATMPARDPIRSGSIELDFDAARDLAPCNGAPREDAQALAVLVVELDGRRIESCIEPIVYGPRGLPAIDSTGAWHGSAADRRYGIVLAPQGYDGRTREAALVWYYDAAGEPRWALGSGDVAAGAAEIELSSFTAGCLGCARTSLASTRAGTLTHRMHGFCGRVGGRATIALSYPGPARGELVRRNAPLERLSSARCY